jgi:hypothetical protein
MKTSFALLFFDRLRFRIRPAATALLWSAVTAGLGAATPPAPTLSPVPPKDIPFPATATQAETFAWQMLVALNWPALAGQRGEADPARKIGAPGPTVWETFKGTDQIFLAGGADPGPWNSAATATSATRPRALTQTAKALQHVLQLSGVNQAVGGPLTDQKGNLVYYEKAANQVSYDFIRQKKLYSAAVQQGFGPVTFPFGALEVKAAWRILTPADKVARYHTVSATVGGQAQPVTVGLVGFHLIVKTPNAPQWIWGTFEQVDNVPPLVDGVASSFHDPHSTQPANRETKPGTPTQVTRMLLTLPASVRALNAAWQQALAGTPWQYYQLIDAQYPTNPKDPATFVGDPTPTLLANTVLETYIQPTSSCIDCHSTARSQGGLKSDFSFLLLNAQ